MSRIPFENVWFSYHTLHLKANCPICQKEIHKDEHLDTIYSWNRSHIISTANGGPDWVINLMVICKDCNSEMKKDDLFDFMAKKGKITVQEAQFQRNSFLSIIKNYDPICVAMTKEGRRCSNRKSVLQYETCFHHMEPLEMMEIDDKKFNIWTKVK